MPHSADDPTLLPKPPPPRPARRDAAIEAALRRFDGVEESPSSTPAKARRSWAARPQLAWAMTACLVAVIGLPTAFIVMRGGNSPVFQAPSPPATASRQAGEVQNAIAPEALPAQPETKPGSVAPPVAALVEPKQDSAAAPAASKPADELAAAEPSTVGYVAAAPPPPPPPPPPPAPMLAEKSVAGAASNGVVVTGSRIPQPNVSNREDNALGRAQTADASSAPDWVLKDASYATFLKRLQAAVRANDRGAVIKLIAVPLRVNFDSGSRLYRDARSVRADYERIFTPRVTQAILGQRFDQLFGRDRGLMIGSGQVWFDHTCTNAQCSPPGPVRITAVNP